MSMRIISPTGRLITIKTVVPFVEEQFFFNGSKRIMSSMTKDNTVQANALRLSAGSNEAGNVFSATSSVFVGNLQPDKIKEITDSLLVKGFYDFSTMQYQKLEMSDVCSNRQKIGVDFLPYYKEEFFDIGEYNPMFSALGDMHTTEDICINMMF